MKKILFINGAVEFIAGLILFLRPDILFSAGSESASFVIAVKMYGLLALAFGGISLVIGKHGEEEKLIRFSSLIIIVFHLLIGFQSYGAYAGGYLPNPGAFVFHLGLAVLFAGFFLHSKK